MAVTPCDLQGITTPVLGCCDEVAPDFILCKVAYGVVASLSGDSAQATADKAYEQLDLISFDDPLYDTNVPHNLYFDDFRVHYSVIVRMRELGGNIHVHHGPGSGVFVTPELIPIGGSWWHTGLITASLRPYYSLGDGGFNGAVSCKSQLIGPYLPSCRRTGNVGLVNSGGLFTVRFVDDTCQHIPRALLQYDSPDIRPTGLIGQVRDVSNGFAGQGRFDTRHPYTNNVGPNCCNPAP